MVILFHRSIPFAGALLLEGGFNLAGCAALLHPFAVIHLSVTPCSADLLSQL
ncbi:MAG TPA: hypothetical protein VKA69_07845 [Desulfobacteria bacterium]|nr:hypothetical protein [Desulfobacteria bacterium]